MKDNDVIERRIIMLFNKKMYKVVEIIGNTNREAIFFNKKDFNNYVKELKNDKNYKNIETFNNGAVAWN